jgi:thiamine biosynthesis protein ThiS
VLIVNDRDRIDWRPGMTVQDVLDVMRYDFALMTVSVNEELVQVEDYARQQVPDGARVSVFHLAHGG